MRKFVINVNGNQYEVEVEEVRDGSTVAATPAAPAAPQASQAPQAAPAAKADTSVPSGAAKVTAPMPGTILAVNVSKGDTVKKGDVVAILEAMKMENEIAATQDGTITSVNVAKGASVNSGDVIVSIG